MQNYSLFISLHSPQDGAMTYVFITLLLTAATIALGIVGLYSGLQDVEPDTYPPDPHGSASPGRDPELVP